MLVGGFGLEVVGSLAVFVAVVFFVDDTGELVLHFLYSLFLVVYYSFLEA